MTYNDMTDVFEAERVNMRQEEARRYSDIVKAIGADNLELAKVPSDDPDRPPANIDVKRDLADTVTHCGQVIRR